MGNARNPRHSRAPLRGAAALGFHFQLQAMSMRESKAPSSSFVFTMPEEEGTFDQVSGHLLATAANIFGWAGDPTE